MLWARRGRCHTPDRCAVSQALGPRPAPWPGTGLRAAENSGAAVGAAIGTGRLACRTQSVIASERKTRLPRIVRTYDAQAPPDQCIDARRAASADGAEVQDVRVSVQE